MAKLFKNMWKTWHQKVQIIKHHLVVETCSDPWFLLKFCLCSIHVLFFQKKNTTTSTSTRHLHSFHLNCWASPEMRIRTGRLSHVMCLEFVHRKRTGKESIHLLRNLNKQKWIWPTQNQWNQTNTNYNRTDIMIYIIIIIEWHMHQITLVKFTRLWSHDSSKVSLMQPTNTYVCHGDNLSVGSDWICNSPPTTIRTTTPSSLLMIVKLDLLMQQLHHLLETWGRLGIQKRRLVYGDMDS